MSQFPQVFSPTKLATYHPNVAQTTFLYYPPEWIEKFGLFGMSLSQGYEIYQSEFTVSSIDTSIAVLGGYSAIVWYVLSALLTWYQQWHYNNALVVNLYTTNGNRRNNASEGDN